MDPAQHARRRRHSSQENAAPREAAGFHAESTLVPQQEQPDEQREGFTRIYGSLSPWKAGVISMGSAIGTGLMIGSGRTLAVGGPTAIMVSYALVGFTVYLVLSALGEVAAWIPQPSTVADQAFRFCDPALGFALGWIYWMKYAVITANQLTAATLVMALWLSPHDINPGVWITIFLILITAVNYIRHTLPSKVEFYVSTIKLVVMSGLMILSLVLVLGVRPNHRTTGFQYRFQPGVAVRSKDGIEVFFRTCGALSSATFAYIGSERSGILARSPNVPQAMNRAIKHTFYRIVVFHLVGITLLGLILPYRTVSSFVFRSTAGKMAASPFVAALIVAGIAVLPHILNGCLLLFILSIAAYDLFLATAALADLALRKRAPMVLSRVNRNGVPVYALAVSVMVASWAYVNVSSDSSVVFGYLVDLVTMLGLLTWISILITHICFVRARKAQGIPDRILVFRARFGLAGTWLALALCVFISSTMIFNSLPIRDHKIHFDVTKFLASYVGIPVYVTLYLGHRIILKSKHINPKDADFWSDKQITTTPENELQALA
ncbi:Uncharacterized protein PECH_008526 [Penicillium ucsense]|uniref:Amino acid permease/ SLC12A domain-containing protein n=1 Tax=Penicillium ucsense TaxID=2839758 RepID=A0A8J8W3N6_9EURO|nr:Uncharacterized protein PECM_006571 [Penicillium ucsense]KAF7734062.1 Uncharacterized protein PECH_008526 [Penicillium ucsense]